MANKNNRPQNKTFVSTMTAEQLWKETDNLKVHKKNMSLSIITGIGHIKQDNPSISQDRDNEMLNKYLSKGVAEEIAVKNSADQKRIDTEFIIDVQRNYDGGVIVNGVTLKDGGLILDQKENFIGVDPATKSEYGTIKVEPISLYAEQQGKVSDTTVYLPFNSVKEYVLNKEDALILMGNEGQGGHGGYIGNVSAYEISKLMQTQTQLAEIMRSDDTGFFQTDAGQKLLNDYVQSQINTYIEVRKDVEITVPDSFRRTDGIYRKICGNFDGEIAPGRFLLESRNNTSEFLMGYYQHKVAFYEEAVKGNYGSINKDGKDITLAEKEILEEKLYKARHELTYIELASQWDSRIIAPIAQREKELIGQNTPEAKEALNDIRSEKAEFSGEFTTISSYNRLLARENSLMEKITKLSSYDSMKQDVVNNEDFVKNSGELSRYYSQLSYIRELIKNHPENEVNKMTFDSGITSDFDRLKIDPVLLNKIISVEIDPVTRKPEGLDVRFSPETMGSLSASLKYIKDVEQDSKATDEEKQIVMILKQNIEQNNICLNTDEYIYVRSRIMKEDFINVMYSSDEFRSKIIDAYHNGAIEEEKLESVFKTVMNDLDIQSGKNYTYYEFRDFISSGQFKEILQQNADGYNAEDRTPLSRIEDLSSISRRDFLAIREATVIEINNSNFSDGRLAVLREELEMIDKIIERNKLIDNENFREMRTYDLDNPYLIRSSNWDKVLNEDIYQSLREMEKYHYFDKYEKSDLGNILSDIENSQDLINKHKAEIHRIDKELYEILEEEEKNKNNDYTEKKESLISLKEDLEREIEQELKRIDMYKTLITNYDNENSYSNRIINLEIEISTIQSKLQSINGVELSDDEKIKIQQDVNEKLQQLQQLREKLEDTYVKPETVVDLDKLSEELSKNEYYIKAEVRIRENNKELEEINKKLEENSKELEEINKKLEEVINAKDKSIEERIKELDEIHKKENELVEKKVEINRTLEFLKSEINEDNEFIFNLRQKLEQECTKEIQVVDEEKIRKDPEYLKASLEIERLKAQLDPKFFPDKELNDIKAQIKAQEEVLEQIKERYTEKGVLDEEKMQADSEWKTVYKEYQHLQEREKEIISKYEDIKIVLESKLDVLKDIKERQTELVGKLQFDMSEEENKSFKNRVIDEVIEEVEDKKGKIKKEDILLRFSEEEQEKVREILKEDYFKEAFSGKEHKSDNKISIIVNDLEAKKEHLKDSSIMISNNLDNPAYLDLYYRQLLEKKENGTELTDLEKSNFSAIEKFRLFSDFELRKIALEENVQEFLHKKDLSVQEFDALKEQTLRDGKALVNEAYCKTYDLLQDSFEETKLLKEQLKQFDELIKNKEKEIQNLEYELEEKYKNKPDKDERIENDVVLKGLKNELENMLQQKIDIEKRILQTYEDIDDCKKQLKTFLQEDTSMTARIENLFDKENIAKARILETSLNGENSSVETSFLKLKESLTSMYATNPLGFNIDFSNVNSGKSNNPTDYGKMVDLSMAEIMSSREKAFQVINQLEENIKYNPYYKVGTSERLDILKRLQEIEEQKLSIKEGTVNGSSYQGFSIDDLNDQIQKYSKIKHIELRGKGIRAEMNNVTVVRDERLRELSKLEDEESSCRAKLKDDAEEIKKSKYFLKDDKGNSVDANISVLNNGMIEISGLKSGQYSFILSNDLLTEYKIEIPKDSDKSVVINVDESALKDLKTIEEYLKAREVIKDIKLLYEELGTLTTDEIQQLKEKFEVKEVSVDTKVEISTQTVLSDKEKEDLTNKLYAKYGEVQLAHDASDEDKKKFEGEFKERLDTLFKIVENNAERVQLIENNAMSITVFDSQAVQGILDRAGNRIKSDEFQDYINHKVIDVNNVDIYLERIGIQLNEQELKSLERTVHILALERINNTEVAYMSQEFARITGQDIPPVNAPNSFLVDIIKERDTSGTIDFVKGLDGKSIEDAKFIQNERSIIGMTTVHTSETLGIDTNNQLLELLIKNKVQELEEGKDIKSSVHEGEILIDGGKQPEVPKNENDNEIDNEA